METSDLFVYHYTLKTQNHPKGKPAMSNQILIEGVEVSLSSGRPFTCNSQGGEFAGIMLSFSVPVCEEARIEALFAQETVAISDPFAKRKYRGTFYRHYSYPEGSKQLHYLAEVREIAENHLI